MKDKDIIINILNGNKELFALLMDKYHNEIFVYIFNITGNYDTTDDLVQDVFLKVYENLTKYNSTKSGFRTWLYRVCSNHVLNHITKRKYRLDQSASEYQDYMVSESSGVEEDLVLEDRARDIMSVVQKKLKPNYKKIALLYYFAGKTVHEVNEILGISEKTIYYALKTIEKKIKEDVTYERS